MAVKNETWIILVIVVLSGVLIALSLTKNKAQDQSSSAVSQADVLKPDHTQADMQEIAAVKTSAAMV